MKIFLDTANLEAIKKYNDININPLKSKLNKDKEIQVKFKVLK